MGKVILEWGYTPTNYFDNDIIVESDQYHLKISDGLVVVVLKTNDPDLTTSQKKYNNIIESHFIIQLIEKRIYYEIKERAPRVEHENGHADVYLKPDTIKITSSSYANLSPNGNIVSDTKEEERNKQKEFLLKIQNVLDKDKIVLQIINSYKNSILYPNDELVYLYEIRDAISTYFHSESNAKSRLKITNSELKELGRICNALPLKQSRHRGKMIDGFKDSKGGELETARSISRKIIHSFINFLDNN